VCVGGPLAGTHEARGSIPLCEDWKIEFGNCEESDMHYRLPGRSGERRNGAGAAKKCDCPIVVGMVRNRQGLYGAQNPVSV